MALDLYAPCPCGSGKKLKFCCTDVGKDLEEVVNALEGNQRIAALDRINRGLEKHPDSPALLSLKASTLLELREFENAEKCIATFLANAPQNPVALAYSALIDATHTNVREAVLKTQQALEIASLEVPIPLYEAIATLASVLVQLGHYQSARQHLLLQVGLEGGAESPTMKQYSAVRASDAVPLIERSDLQLAAPALESSLPAADIALWNGALEDGRKARWFKAVEQFLMLASRHRQEAGLWHNVAMLYGWLADEASAAKAWRQKSKCAGISELDALEAESLAQALEESSDCEFWQQVQVELPIADFSALKEHLLSNKHFASVQFDPDEYRENEIDVPPQSVFRVLSAETPPEGELEYQAIPQLLGTLLLFGKQTDRDARCDLVVTKKADYDTVLANIRRELGPQVGEPKEPEIIGRVDRSKALWTFDRQVPPWTKPEQMVKWINDFRHDALSKEWGNIPRGAFGGKSAFEACSDPANRMAISAALLDVEISLRESGQDVAADIAELRKKLNAIEIPVQKLAANLVGQIPSWRLPWIDVSELSEDELEQAFYRANSIHARAAVKHLGTVMQTKITDEKKKETLWAVMAQTAPSHDDALTCLGNAMQIAIAGGRSPAAYKLMEFSLRVRVGEVEAAQNLLADIRTNHFQEPGVANALTRMMVDMGLISPEQVAASRGGVSVNAGGGVTVSGSGGPPAGSSSGLWTGDGPATAPGKSKLIIPGMD